MAGTKKEHDWFAESLANPSFTNTDFKSVGINAANTSLAPIDVYLKSPDVQRQEIFQTNGKFDESKVRQYYANVTKTYNTLAQDTYEQDLDADRSAIFSQYDLFVSPERRSNVIPAVTTFKPNPDHITFGLVGFNTPGKITKTPEELSESQPIWDPDTKTYTKDTPEDSFFKYFFRPTVLATWDYNADANGNPTNDPSKVVYYKGQPKVNENGEYYQEFLNGRSSDGKKLLHKTNILTREDSWLNKYDPFDNDGFDKSVWGSIALNAIKIVPLFIPYVREAYLYTNLGLGAAQALTTLGKMFTGSDNAFLNTASSVMESFHTTPSEYAGEHMLSMENILNMVGDTLEFIKGQRFLAEKAPQWFGSKIPQGEEAFNAKVAEMTATKIRNMKNIVGTSEQSLQGLSSTLKLEATAELQKQIQNYQKLGQQISKNYMAITFGTHTYSTAKSQGVSDTEATILTLGAIGGQYALLSSHIGNWIFPEAKLEAQELKMIAKKLPEVIESDSFKTAQAALETAATTGEKVKAFKDIFKLGRSLAGKVYNSPIQTAAQAGIASSIASGVEMTAFSVLDDVIAETYNIAQWMRGSDHRMSAFENIGERYLTSFLGGALAGVMSAKELYNASKAMHSLNPDQAFEKMVSLVANGKKEQFLKEVDQTSWGNKYLSTEEYSLAEDGSRLYKQGTEINNQDKLIKDAIHQQVDIIEKVLKSNDVMLSPYSLIKDDKTLGLVKTSLLQGSVVVKDYIGNLNKKMAELVKVQQEIAGISDPETRKQEKEIKDSEKEENKSEIPTNELEALRNRRKEIIEELHKYKTGEIMKEYLPKAIFDMSPGINYAYINGNFISYTEAQYKKKFSELDQATQIKAQEDYAKWVNDNKLTAVNQAYDLFSRINPVVSEVVGKLKSEGITKDLTLNNTKALKHFLIENMSMQAMLDDNPYIPIDKNTRLIGGSRDFNNKTEGRIMRSLIDEINATNTSRENDKDLFDNLRDYANSNEEFKDERETLNQQINALEALLYRDEIIDRLLSDFQDRKYINYTIENRLKDMLKGGLLDPNTIFHALYTGGDFDLEPLYMDNLSKLFTFYDVNKHISFNEFIERIQKTGIEEGNEDYTKQKQLLSKVDSLESYNLLDTLNTFGKQVTTDRFDLKTLFQELGSIFNKNQQTIDKFLLDQDKISQIELAKLVIDLFRSGTIATNNVVDNIENIIGFNPAVNSMIKGSNLTVQNPKDVAAQLYDLNILETRLNYYKELALYARANKFNEIANVENGFRTTLYKQISSKIENLPVGWAGVNELKQTIGNLNDLQRLSNITFSQLTDEAQTKLIKEYVQYEKALHDFFQKNLVKIQNPDKLKEFLNKFNLLDENNASIGQENFQDDQALVWYLASIAALDPQKFYSNYTNNDIGNLAPTFTRMTQVYLLTSMLANKEVFDHFVAAYNESVDEKLKIESPIDYKLDGRRVKFGNIGLLQSGAGAGKSFAILPQFVAMLKQIDPNLVKDIWITSTCPVGEEENNKAAKNLTKQWKLDTKNTFTKTQLMGMISNEWHESVSEDMLLKIDESDTEFDEDRGILKYNFKLRQDHKNLPKVIIIDEIADYSEADMELIDRFAKKNGIFVVAAGDLQQVGLVGKGTITVQNKDVDNVFYLGTNQFVHTFYNTANYRTNNSLQDKNILSDRVMLSQIEGRTTEAVDVPSYQYYIDKQNGLSGRMVLRRTETVEIAKAKEVIDIMVKTMDNEQKIGYVYDDENSDIYKYIKENYKDKFDFFYKYPVKGEEAQYYIFDLSKESLVAEKTEQFNRQVLLKTLYTVFTRSKQGTLFIKPSDSTVTDNLQSKESKYVAKAELDFVQLGKYSKRILNTLKEVYPDVSKIEIKPLAKESKTTNVSETTSEDPNKNTDLELPEEQKENKADGSSSEEFGKPLEHLSVKRENVGLPDDSIAYILPDEQEVTLIAVDEEPVEKQVVALNKVVQPVVRKFEYMSKKSRILFGDESYSDSDIREVLNFGLYTRFNNYTGLISDADFGFIESKGNGRVDNYYGLQKLFNVLGVDKVSSEDYTLINKTSAKDHNIRAKRNVQRFLQNIRELNYRISDRKELEKSIFELIENTFGITLDDPYIRFMWESTYHKADPDHEDFGKFYKSKEETPDDPYLKENSAKGLTMVLGSSVGGKDQMLLSVPLAKLPYWKTIVKNSEGSSGDFLRDLYNEVKNRVYNDSSIRPEAKEYRLAEGYMEELENILRDNSNHSYTLGVASLYHLLNIYLYNDIGAVFIDPSNTHYDKAAVLNDPLFTVAKYFNSTGPFVFANERLADAMSAKDYDVNSRIASNTAEYHDIQTLVDGGQFTISPILVTKEDVKTFTDVVRVQAGRPFILVGDSSLEQHELFDVWTKQLADPNLPKRVKEVYVLNPKSDIGEYLGQLKTWADKNKLTGDDLKDLPLIGNDLTSYHIINFLKSSDSNQLGDTSNSTDALTYAFSKTPDHRLGGTVTNPGIASEIEAFLAKVNGVTDSAVLLSELKKQSGYRKMTYGRLFNLTMRLLLDPKWYYGNINPPMQDRILDFIAHSTVTDNLQEIFYNIRFNEKLPEEANGTSVYTIKTDEPEGNNQFSYKIAGKSFQVNMVMTPILVGDLYPLLAKISTDINFRRGKGKDYMSNTGNFANNDARQQNRFVSNGNKKTNQPNPVKIDKTVAKNLGLITSNDQLLPTNLPTTVKRFHDNGYPAFEINGITYFLTNKPSEAGNNKIKNVTVGSGNEVLVEYEGDSNVKLRISPIYIGGEIKEFSVSQAERKVKKDVTQVQDYFNELLEARRNQSLGANVTEDDLEVLDKFFEYVSIFNSGAVPTNDYNLDLDGSNKIIISENNFLRFLKEDGNYAEENAETDEAVEDVIDALKSKLEQPGTTSTVSVDTIEKFVCSIIFKI